MVYMKLEYIKAVLALSKSKSFGEAAENVFSTQSSLSKQIISVEKELGIKLIHRATKKAVSYTHLIPLTPAVRLYCFSGSSFAYGVL